MSRKTDSEKEIPSLLEFLEGEGQGDNLLILNHETAYATGERESTPYSQVEVTFTATGNGTVVRLVHSSVHSEDVRRGFGGGWDFASNTMSALLSKPDG